MLLNCVVLATALELLTGAAAQSQQKRQHDGQSNTNGNHPGAVEAAAAEGVHSGQTSPPFYPSPWMAPGTADWTEAYDKAIAFVAQLTLLEKINITTGVGWEGGQCVGQTGSVPRLGLKSLCMQDSPVGVRSTDYNSAFSSGQSVAATFDRGLFYQRGLAMGQEHRGKGVTSQLGPVVGPLGRAPEGGRNWEGFSPDPYLSGVAVAETVKGIQDAGVIACTKHFIANEQEHFRQAPEASTYGDVISDSLSSNIDDVTLHELYLWPFADAVRAGTGSIMCSYNQINNSYGCQNSKLLNGILKGELGFQGFIMSDWAAQHSGVSSAVAGLDVTRIMAAYFKVGLSLDEPGPNFDSWTLETYAPLHYAVGLNTQQVNFHVDVRGDHASLIRDIRAKSTVLLKNTNNALPLSKPKFVAVIGEDAGPNVSGPNGCADRGCSNGTLAMGWGSGTANFPYLVTPDTALQNQALIDGSRYESIFDNYAWTTIESLASQTGVTAIVFVNADSGEGFLSPDGNEGDRNNLTLWHDGDKLVKNVSSLCNNTIVVIHSVGPTLLTDWYDSPNITAILWAGLPGQESGNSITDVLYGKVNPAARTPFTWGPTRESYGTDVVYKPNNGQGAPQSDFSEGVYIDYRAFDMQNITPIYEFGYGLSYTSFSYSNLVINKASTADYIPTTGVSVPAPIFGNISTSLEDYLFPSGNFPHIPLYIYPYVNVTNEKAATAEPNYGETADKFLPAGATDSSPQPINPAGGAPGGNPQLYDVLYTIRATITNTGKLDGEEVPQLYVSLGGPNQPKIVLRGFERLSIAADTSVTFSADLTRRDLSNWDPVSQNWVITSEVKTVYVGSSSRHLPLSQALS